MIVPSFIIVGYVRQILERRAFFEGDIRENRRYVFPRLEAKQLYGFQFNLDSPT